MFDEGHAAKNLNPGKQGSSQTGQRVFNLQELLPKARVVYVSATGATEPHRMSSSFPPSFLPSNFNSVFRYGVHDKIRIVGSRDRVRRLQELLERNHFGWRGGYGDGGDGNEGTRTLLQVIPFLLRNLLISLLSSHLIARRVSFIFYYI